MKIDEQEVNKTMNRTVSDKKVIYYFVILSNEYNYDDDDDDDDDDDLSDADVTLQKFRQINLQGFPHLPFISCTSSKLIQFPRRYWR